MKRANGQTAKLATQLIVALDVDSFHKAKKLVDLLYPKVKIFKVGLQLFLAAENRIIRYVKRKGAKVFLDLKFYDIPNTVAQAAKEMVRLGVDIFTVHSQGGLDMLIAAKQAVGREAKRLRRQPPLLLGVTVLTSKENKGNIRQVAIKLAKQAKLAGLDGVVCSGREAKTVRKNLGKNFIIVTPGIRLASKIKDDQKRIVTPKEAQGAGANYLVMGRPIIKAGYPLLVIKKVLSEIKN